jgi:hypothetical protein
VGLTAFFTPLEPIARCDTRRSEVPSMGRAERRTTAARGNHDVLEARDVRHNSAPTRRDCKGLLKLYCPYFE